MPRKKWFIEVFDHNNNTKEIFESTKLLQFLKDNDPYETCTVSAVQYSKKEIEQIERESLKNHG